MSDRKPVLLVVDDNDDNRFTLTRRLNREGYTEIAIATNGREALDIVRSRAVDLVLLDIAMPEMDGYAVLEHLKSDMRLRHIPVIMISASEEIENIVKCIEKGAEDYLPKPFNPVLLKARIGACLEKKRLRDQEATHLEQIRAEKRRSEEILHSILPFAAAHELKTTGKLQPRRYDDVAVLFCDVVGFTAYCDRHPAEEVVGHLQSLVDAFEAITERHRMEKIKTIGDAFLATAGLLVSNPDPVLSCVKCGLEMAEVARRLPTAWETTVGIHFGPVMAGIVGHRMYLFDIWGDTVNVAARACEHGRAGALTMTQAAWFEVQDLCRGKLLGAVEVKGKGSLDLVECQGLREATPTEASS